jgi:hypothetical protein
MDHPTAPQLHVFYGVNFELSYEAPTFSQTHYGLEIRPIVGVRNSESLRPLPARLIVRQDRPYDYRRCLTPSTGTVSPLTPVSAVGNRDFAGQRQRPRNGPSNSIGRSQRQNAWGLFALNEEIFV